MADLFTAFLVSVGASVVGNYIYYVIKDYMRKWLGRDDMETPPPCGRRQDASPMKIRFAKGEAKAATA